MKHLYLFLALGVLFSVALVSYSPTTNQSSTRNEYIVIAWNDLGMHCANKDFSNMSILPPYNNQYAHVIQKGSESGMPVVMDSASGVYVTYEIPGNTYSVGKTNFWDYAQHLFGVTLQPNIGLTGLGLAGNMTASGNYHSAIGIPNTPFTDSDLVNPDPYQLTSIKAYNQSNELLATTQSVIPVSNEINCVSSGCHSSEMNILNEHESVPGFDISNKPILCANCHADNALNLPGSPGVDPFSQVIHQTHGGITNNCYKCHPGPNTQCFRDVMHSAGLTCQDCHGSVSNVGNTIEAGREPWLEEPSCGDASCHGAQYAEEPGLLYRQSKGHGGLYCSTCHNSPHAILPSENDRDNLQVISLQGYADILRECTVCHGYVPNAPGPHGFNPVGIRPVSGNPPENDQLLAAYPNPASWMANIPFSIISEGKVLLEVISTEGKTVKVLVDEILKPGEYKAEFYTQGLPQGTYYCRLVTGRNTFSEKILVIKD